MTYTTYRADPGFTLVEVVVGVGIFALVAVSSSLLLASLLRGAAKARAQAQVRSEGAAALGVIERFIGFSQQVTACAADGSSLSIINQSGQATTFACQEGYLASNSARLTSAAVGITNCTGVFVCDIPAPLTRWVTVNFRLTRAGTQLPAEASAGTDFQSQVELRN